MELRINDYNELKKNFSSPRSAYRAMPYYILDGDLRDAEHVTAQLTAIKKAGFGGLVLRPTPKMLPPIDSPELDDALRSLLAKCEKLDLKVILSDDVGTSGSLGGRIAEVEPDSVAKVLHVYEYACDADKPIHRRLINNTDPTVSLVAYELDTHEIIDLRSRRSAGYVDWNPPHGNWNIKQFVVSPCPEAGVVNYLNYEDSRKYLCRSIRRMVKVCSGSVGSTVIATLSRGVCFAAPNRRMWDEDFNRVFRGLNGFDPSPYYPALFDDIGEATERIRALFHNCRAYMLEHGFFKAIADYARADGIKAIVIPAEGKSTAAPWIFGDALGVFAAADATAADLSYAYLYGLNAVKMASSSAVCGDKELTACTVYEDYAVLNPDILTREAINAYVRGANLLMPYLFRMSETGCPSLHCEDPAELRGVVGDYAAFTARCQAMLRGGRQVCDIALLYPIFSLEADTAMYEEHVDGFEYPPIPGNADYMGLINILLTYCSRDLCVLHPATLDRKCFVEDGLIHLANAVNHASYRVLILPAASMLGVRNLRKIREFYDTGGKIIATGVLPGRAFEYRGSYSPDETVGSDPDAAVRETIRYIFGVLPDEINQLKEYYVNKNDHGGEAYFLPSSETAADGTILPDAALISRILASFDFPADIEVTDPPRVPVNGILSLPLPAFRAINAHNGVKSGGVWGVTHRRTGGCDVFYFANTTHTDYHGDVFLRGKFVPEEWDPHTGRIRRIACEYTERHGETYTRVTLTVEAPSSVFLVCRDPGSIPTLLGLGDRNYDDR